MSDELGFESGFEAESFPGELLGEESEQEDEYRGRGYSRSPRSYRPAPRRYAPMRRWTPRPSYSRPYPRPRPWPPRYRWPAIAWPAPPYPVAAPSFDAPPVEEPPPDAGADAAPDVGPEDAGGDQPQAEVAAAVKQAVGTLPAAQRPVYRSVGRLADAINNASINGPGLYLIMFKVGNQLKGYHGMARDRRRRLMQHRLGAQLLGLSIDNHRVLVADVPQATLRPTELAINTFLLNHHRQHFTNQRRELEFGELGEASVIPGETWV